MTSHRSEIVLGVILLVIVGFVRIYVGGNEGFMMVWKGEFNYNDTLVNLDDIEKMSHDEIAKTHPAVLYQLEEMGIHDAPSQRRAPVKPKNVENPANPPSPTEAPSKSLNITEPPQKS
jgi:hypothetical protein